MKIFSRLKHNLNLFLLLSFSSPRHHDADTAGEHDDAKHPHPLHPAALHGLASDVEHGRRRSQGASPGVKDRVPRD